MPVYNRKNKKGMHWATLHRATLPVKVLICANLRQKCSQSIKDSCAFSLVGTKHHALQVQSSFEVVIFRINKHKSSRNADAFRELFVQFRRKRAVQNQCCSMEHRPLHTLVNYFSFSSSFQQLMGKLQYFRCTKTVLYTDAARAVVEKPG